MACNSIAAGDPSPIRKGEVTFSIARYSARKVQFQKYSARKVQCCKAGDRHPRGSGSDRLGGGLGNPSNTPTRHAGLGHYPRAGVCRRYATLENYEPAFAGPGLAGILTATTL
jgi:hypothetical protein